MLLIRNGLIHTMATAGSLNGDILVDKGKIVQIGSEISSEGLTPEDIVDARDLQVCPGLVDAHMHLVHASEDEAKNERDLCGDALASGVTTQGLWPEHSGSCIVRHGAQRAENIREPMICIRQDAMAEARLRQRMVDAAASGQRIACEVYGEKTLSHLLRLQRETGCALVLTHLVGCEELVEDIIASGSEVIMGACVLRSGSGAYAFAARLAKAGVKLALTSDYPATRLHHLPLCAGLFVRSGMDHHTAMQSVTINAARLLRVDDVCGSIEVGKRADFTIFDGDPLMLATARVMTVSGGKVVQKS